MFKKLAAKFISLFYTGIEVSYSRINAYLACPWKYKLLYLDGIRVQPNPYISLGISIHRTLEYYHANKSNTLESLLESYDQFWVNEGFISPQQTHDFYERGRKILENYYHNNINLNTKILYVEKDFNIKIGKNRLRGTIDRIDMHPDGSFEVIDYKTHSDIWSQNKVDTDLQLSLYAIACEKIIGVAPSILSYYFLAHGCRLTTSRSKEQIDKALNIIEDVSLKISKNIFPPDTTHCGRCDFKKKCEYSSINKNMKAVKN